MKEKKLRSTDRVSLAIPLQVSASESPGQSFKESARTLVINRHGATIVVNRKLQPGQLITIQRVGADKDKSADARVLGQMGGQENGYVYGVVFSDANVNLWNIKFPPLAESEKAVARLLLECRACQAREVAYLSELEAEVFDANGFVSRSCKQCNAWTSWQQGFHDASPDFSPSTRRAPTTHTKQNRKDLRVQLKKLSACIRQPGFGEEVVRVEDVSRGGLRFLSRNTYYEGSSIEVAIPYTAGAANIFVVARIVRAQESPEKGLREYGVAYANTSRFRPPD